MKKIWIAAVVAVGALIVYHLAAPPRVSSPSVESGHDAGAEYDKAAPLTEPGLDGKPVSLADFKGKVVLVDFWATWCDPCKEEIPMLGKMYRARKGKGFAIIGVSMDEEGDKAVRRFKAKHPIPYVVALNNGTNAPKGWVVPGLPTAYLISRDGAVLKRWFGQKDDVELKKAVDAALAKK
jgi:thiol-disulfide isomerase/thioredoxin